MNTSALNNCRFCAIAAGQHGFAYDVPIMAEQGYFGLASIGGFVPGWSLVCPREHRNNVAQDYANPRFQATVSQIVRAVTAEYGEVAVFEHGATRDGSPTACGTCHAHLHVVPFDGNLADLALKADAELCWLPTRLQDVGVTAAGFEYLFVANRYDGLSTTGQLARLQEPRSQFFRRLIASQLKSPHLADYRAAPLEEVSTATAERVRAAVQRLSRRAA